MFRNTEIHYTVSGSGPIVVWLHGFMEHLAIWENQLSYFNEFTTNVCIDLLGHGKTGIVDQVHTMELMAEAVQVVLNHLKIKKYALVGHSMGGYVGLALLEKQPLQVTHFVLLNSTSNPDTQEKKVNRDRAASIVQQNKEAYVRMSIVNLFSPNSRKKLNSTIENLIESCLQMNASGITAALLGMKIRLARTELLTAFTGKKMIVAGKEDVVLDFESLQAEAKQTQAILLPLQGGHMSYMEASQTLNNELKTFFDL